ncbi:hypothetical protein [Cupriavidus sp. D384]|uniref:hypothetical protein n=1 Tax=Cupriavidus sp. D384 TaxID=1538095 RepID=UPI0027D7E44B|nr:hypothetical protein [Cupriavidus sp. D384]
MVLSGVGLTQEWGKAVQEIRARDVVWCPPGVKHWHGASPGTPMTNLAVTGKCRRAERHMDGEGQRCAVPREISMLFDNSR